MRVDQIDNGGQHFLLIVRLWTQFTMMMHSNNRIGTRVSHHCFVSDLIFAWLPTRMNGMEWYGMEWIRSAEIGSVGLVADICWQAPWHLL
ncbi:hypothetical protein BLOT_011256 [Blomia tropicalis]|nr:hypothetical protein BLOT_011256 [Blomia tropicalis]